MLLTPLMMMIATDDVPAARLIQPGPLPLSEVCANIAARFATLDVNADGDRSRRG
jgi:hypothetical protein